MEYGHTLHETRERYSFSLVLDRAEASTDSVTSAQYWSVNWGSVIPMALPAGAKFRCTHRYISDNFLTNTDATTHLAYFPSNGWVGLRGLPGMQVAVQSSTSPSLTPINVFALTQSAWNDTSWYAHLEAQPRSFICGNPATNLNASTIMIGLMGFPTTDGVVATGIEGVHMLDFELVSDN